MSIQRDLFEIVLDLKTGSITSGAMVLKASLHGIDQQVNRTKTGVGSLGNALTSLGGIVKGVAVGLGALGTATVAAGAFAISEASKLDSLERSLVAIEGSADKAKAAMDRLFEIAKGPGHTQMSAVEMYRSLRSVDLSRDYSFRMTAALGNALALSDASPEAASRVAVQLTQVAGSPFLQGDELRSIAENLPKTRGIIKEKFGVTSTDELRKQGITSQQVLDALLEGFEKLPKVLPGIQESLVNLQDSINRSAGEVGKGLFGGLVNPIKTFTDALTDLNGKGVFTKLGEEVGSLFSVLEGSDATSILLNFVTAVDMGALALRELVKQAPGAAKKVDAWETKAGKINDGIQMLGPLWPINMLFPAKNDPGEVSTGSLGSDIYNAFTYKRNQYGKLAGTPSTPPADDELDAPEDPKKSPAVQILRDIEANTRGLREDIQRTILGGGLQSEQAFNARNIGRGWGNGPSRAGNRIAQIIAEEFGVMMVDSARHRTLSPISH